MSLLGGVTSTLLAPGRLLSEVALSAPKRLLDAVGRDRVAGRRASVRADRALIEVEGTRRADAGRLGDRLATALQQMPGVAWARLNAPLGLVVVALEPATAPRLSDLVAVVERVENDHRTQGSAAATSSTAPTDRADIDRAWWALAATGAGLLLSGAATPLRLFRLPTEVASLISMVDNQPRLRGMLEAAVGRPATDLGMAALTSLGQGLAGGRTGLIVDLAHRINTLSEATALHRAWRAAERDCLADPTKAAAGPVAVERPRPVPSGPVERYADQATLFALGALGLAVPATGDLRRAVNLSLSAVPKAARLGREGFAGGMARLLAGRGAVVLDASALRRLDRVDTVVLDAEVLVTGRLVLGDTVTLPGADPVQVALHLHEMFRADHPGRTRRRGDWVLGPVDRLTLRGRRGVAAQRRLTATGAVHVLGLAAGKRLMAVVGVVAEQSESVDALAAACHRVGARLVVAGPPQAAWTSLADTVLPGGRRLLATVRELQAEGAVVLLVSRHRPALCNADVGIGVHGREQAPPWGAHVLIGDELETAGVVIESCGVAARVSHRGVALSEAGSVLGAVGLLTGRGRGPGSAVGRAATLGVNGAAAVALAHGAWSAREVGNRPLTPPTSRTAWHAMPAAAVLARLDTSGDGLTGAEAGRRQRRLSRSKPRRPSLARAVMTELDNPLTPILAGGAALSAAVGSAVDAGLVAGVTALSALVGGTQRQRTDRAVTQLMSDSAVTARVRRDGAESTVPAEALVPGDVIGLRSGEVVPADCRLLETTDLLVDESVLTGEPFPVAKTSAPVVAATVAQRTSMVYEGSSVTAGHGRAVVVATGDATEAGRSMAAARGAAPPTGVERRLAAITNTTLPIAVSSAAAVVVAGLVRGRPVRDTLGAGVSLAVASVPEGLPFLVSAAQLASARRLAGQGSLVRNPRTIETLGRVDTLCFDKTGTLTQGRISLAAVADLTRLTRLDCLDDEQRRTLAAGLRASSPRHGHPLAHLTDRAVGEGAAAAGVTREYGLAGWRPLATLPFEPSRGFHATLGGAGGTVLLSVKGAPETVLPRCTHLSAPGGPVALDTRRRARLERRVQQLAGQGHRVLAVAQRADRSRTSLADGDVTGLTVLGFLALSDPVRGTADSSLTALRHAGVQIVMITGDHPGTARSVAEQLHVLAGGRVVTGPQLDAWDDDTLDRVLPEVSVVARGTPAHKVRVVQAFQRLHRTIAMTGDGANDAPAIRLADVGIALGHRATPSARAAADLVVTGDRLDAIIAALVEGRAMWASVRQALGILVGGNLGEIAFTVLGSALTGRSPLSARQLLLVNLLTDLAPSMAIALRPPDPAATTTLLAEGPEASLGTALTREIARRAILTAGASTAAWTAARITGRATRARTVALAALVGTQLGQTLATGHPTPAVLAGSLGSAAVLATVIQTPGVSQFFGCTPLGPIGWTIAGTAATAATLVSPLLPDTDLATRDPAQGGGDAEPSGGPGDSGASSSGASSSVTPGGR